MIALIEAWEDQKDQYGTMKDFVDAFYRETKKKTESKKKTETESSSEKKEGGDEESEGSNEVTPRVKVNLLVPSSTKKSKKEKKTSSEKKAKKIVTEMGEETETESRDVKKAKKPSKYLDFLKQWRVDNPGIKGKEAIKQGAAAWQEHKKTTHA